MGKFKYIYFSPDDGINPPMNVVEDVEGGGDENNDGFVNIEDPEVVYVDKEEDIPVEETVVEEKKDPLAEILTKQNETMANLGDVLAKQGQRYDRDSSPNVAQGPQESHEDFVKRFNKEIFKTPDKAMGEYLQRTAGPVINKIQQENRELKKKVTFMSDKNKGIVEKYSDEIEALVKQGKDPGEAIGLVKLNHLDELVMEKAQEIAKKQSSEVVRDVPQYSNGNTTYVSAGGVRTPDSGKKKVYKVVPQWVRDKALRRGADPESLWEEINKNGGGK